MKLHCRSGLIRLACGLLAAGCLRLALPAQAPAPPASPPGPTVAAPAPPSTGRALCLVLPFQDLSADPNLEWIGESFAESLGQSLEGGELEVLTRQQRQSAFDREGIPMAPTLSRATLMQVADNVDARWLILGSYAYNAAAQQLTARAELIDLQQEHLWRFQVQPSPLVRLQWVQARLSWKLRRRMQPDWKPAFLNFWYSQPPVALPAYENYIRGLLASLPAQRMEYFRAAARIQPDYAPAIYRLGRGYLENGDAATALRWLTRLRRRDPHYWRAQFLAGRAALALGENLRAALFFRTIAASLPLPEVLNNWALAEARLGHPLAAQLYQRGLQQTGPKSPGAERLEINLAAYECRQGHAAAAEQWLRRAHDAAPAEEQAKLLRWIAQIQSSAGDAKALAAKMEAPSENFPANRFRQMAAALVDFARRKAGRLARARRLALYLQQGANLLRAGALEGAARDYRAALALDSRTAAAHAGLARIYATRQQWTAAQYEAKAALAIAPNAACHVVLARAAMAARQWRAARRQVDAALALQPDFADARALRTQLNARRER